MQLSAGTPLEAAEGSGAASGDAGEVLQATLMPTAVLQAEVAVAAEQQQRDSPQRR